MTEPHEMDPPEHDSTGPWPDDSSFPSEAEWLTLTPPAGVDTEFVERTAQMVQDDAAWRSLLASWPVPDPSTEFVNTAMRRLYRERSPEWKALLARRTTPEPSPDFVGRVLAALREVQPQAEPVLSIEGGGSGKTPADRTPAGRPWAGPRWLWAAAALLAVGLSLFFVINDHTPTQPPSRGSQLAAAQDFSPNPWGTALARLQDHGLGVLARDRTLALPTLLAAKAGE